MRKLDPIHPGEILGEEYLKPSGLSATALAKRVGVPANRITRLVAGQSSVTADTALRLARAFGTSAQFWMNLQSQYELQAAEDNGLALGDIEPVIAA
jgi:addiction module HigA family antidote